HLDSVFMALRKSGRLRRGSLFLVPCAALVLLYVGGWKIVWDIPAPPNASFYLGALGAYLQFNASFYGLGIAPRLFWSPVVSWLCLLLAMSLAFPWWRRMKRGERAMDRFGTLGRVRRGVRIGVMAWLARITRSHACACSRSRRRRASRSLCGSASGRRLATGQACRCRRLSCRECRWRL